MDYIPELKTSNELIEDEKKKHQEEYIAANKTTISDDELTMFPKPKKGCRKCYDRGYVGWSVSDELPNICTCITNKIGKVSKHDCMTYGEFKIMTSIPKPFYHSDHVQPKSLRREARNEARLERRRTVRERKREMVA